MNLQRIEQLIEKYESGKTSSKEETELKEFFSRENVPFHLRSYKDLFTFFDTSAKEELPDKEFDDRILKAISNDKIIPISNRRTRSIYLITGIAASIIILIGLYFQFGLNQPSFEDTYDDPMLAYAETKKVLLMVSGNLNSGTNELQKVSEFNKGLNELDRISTFETGMKNLEKISILDKSKKIITSKK